MGLYILQSKMSFLNQCAVNPNCKLGAKAPETRQYVSSECVFFKTERDIYIRKLLNTSALQGGQIAKIEYPEFLTHLTLDVSVFPNSIPEQTHVP